VNLAGIKTQFSAQQVVFELLGYQDAVTNFKFKNINWNRVLKEINVQEKVYFLNTDEVLIDDYNNNDKLTNEDIENDDDGLADELFAEQIESIDEQGCSTSRLSVCSVSCLTDYLHRAPELEEMSLYYFYAQVFKESKSKSHSQKQQIELAESHPQHDN
jgi:hypothetical protein